MARDEIVEKLDQFLKRHDPMTEECHALYLLVEARKIIDQGQSRTSYPILKFYADWSVHSRKDHITPEIEQIMEGMYRAIVDDLNSPFPGLQTKSIRAFAYMEQLRKEIAAFLTAHGIADPLTKTKAKWVAFVELLVKVLENQPIVEPTPDVKEFLFETANSGCVIGVMTFRDPVKGYAFYRDGNAY